MRSVRLVVLAALAFCAVVSASQYQDVSEYVEFLESSSEALSQQTPAASTAASCVVGSINHCTGETSAWVENTVIASIAKPGDDEPGLPAGVQVASAASTTSVALMEAEAEAQATCSGTCQLPSLKCAGGAYQHGLCAGAKLCCPKAAAPAAAHPAAAPAAPAAKPAAAPAATGLTGSSSRIKDPTSLYAGGRSVVWADLTTAQQTNARLLVASAKKLSVTNPNKMAYILATANWECHLTPISEWGGKHTRYAPYYGRGFVQLTWKANYATFTKLLSTVAGVKADLVNHPELALVPSNAAFVAAWGMVHGTFTGKKLDDYFTASKSDWTGARRIINGVDKAAVIGALGKAWVKLATTLLA